MVNEISRQKAEGRKQKAEGRRQKAESRRQKAEGRVEMLTSDLSPLVTLFEEHHNLW